MSQKPAIVSDLRARPGATRIIARVALYLAVCWGTLAAVAAGVTPAGPWPVLALALYTTIPLAIFITWRGWPFYPRAAFRLLVVRPFWYTQLLLPLVTAGAVLGLLLGAVGGRAIDGGRIGALIVLAVGALGLLAGYVGAKRLVVRQVDAEVPGLPAAFDGLRIVQLSDLHVGPHSSRRFLERVVAATRKLAPDLIAVTGDLIDDRAEDVHIYSRAFRGLSAPLGVYMIPGNHDVYAGWEAVERNLRAAKLGHVLVNEARLITRGGETLAIVGTGDPAGGARGSSRAAPDVERALATVPGDTTTIAFAHNPSLWPALAARGVALTLSGHTHWGQLALPRAGWSLASPFFKLAMGAHQERDALLYISPGTGYWGVPFRLGASPEVTLVTLRRGPASATMHRARSACAA